MSEAAPASDANPATSSRSLPRHSFRQRRNGSMKSRAMTGVAIGQRLGRTRPAVAAVVTVSVEFPLSDPGVTVGGLKVPVAPAGNPETLSVTAFVKPLPTPVTVMGYVAEPPGLMDCDGGVAVTLKSGAGALTVMLRCT